MRAQIFIPINDLQTCVKILDTVILLRNYNTIRWLMRHTTPNTVNLINMPLGVQWGKHRSYLEYYKQLTFLELTNHRNIPAYKLYVHFPPQAVAPNKFTKPSWMHDPILIKSHQSALLAINYIYYSRFGWDVPIGTEYMWYPC